MADPKAVDKLQKIMQWFKSSSLLSLSPFTSFIFTPQPSKVIVKYLIYSHVHVFLNYPFLWLSCTYLPWNSGILSSQLSLSMVMNIQTATKAIWQEVCEDIVRTESTSQSCCKRTQETRRKSIRKCWSPNIDEEYVNWNLENETCIPCCR